MNSKEAIRATDDRVWIGRTVWLILGLGLLRLVYAFIVPLDLVHDEAYYWDWSRQLDWGYYSKPPMVAWLIALSTSLGGSSAFFVRLPAVVLGTVGLAWVYLLAARFYGRKAGFWTVCLSAATPGNTAVSLLMTIDAPLLFCWSGALLVFWRLFERDSRRGLWLAGAILLVGLGLLAKQTMFGFIVLGGFYLLTCRQDRRELLRPTFWLWAAGSMLFLIPVLWWNSQHGWITLQHTSGHFVGESVSLVKRLSRFGEFVGGQFGVVSPVTCFLMVAVMAAAARAWRSLGRKEWFLFTFSGLPLAGVCVLSCTQRVEPNWPAPFYPAAVVLVVGLALKQFDLRVWPSIREQALVRAATVGAVTVVIAYLVPFSWGLQGSKLDPAVRLRGWRQLGEAVAHRFEELPAPAKTFVVVAAGRAETSELAFYMPQQPRVYLWTPGSMILSQYDVWGGPLDKAGWDALIVTSADRETPPELSAVFSHVEDHGEVLVPIGSGRNHRYHVWRGVGFSAWPGQHGITARAGGTLQR